MNKTALALCVSALALWGCIPGGSGPGASSSFYRLEYVPAASSVIDDAPAAKNPAALLVRVTTSSALRGPRMIEALNDYQIDYAETQRWAEPVGAAFSRILTTGLRQKYAQVEAVPVPAGYRAQYHVHLHIEKLWGTAEGRVVLQASWQITDAKDKPLASDARTWTLDGWRKGDYLQLAQRASSLSPQLVSAISTTLSSLDAQAQNP